MTAETLFQFIHTFAVTFGVIFAIMKVRQFRRSRQREGALVLLHSFQTPDFSKALLLTYYLPDGLSKQEVERRLGDSFYLVYSMTTVWESLGIFVFRREIELGMVADFFSGPIMKTWTKLESYFREEREALHRETIGEWFEWLRDRLADSESENSPIPAQIEHRDWKPARF
jgi:hypothetical protein